MCVCGGGGGSCDCMISHGTLLLFAPYLTHLPTISAKYHETAMENDHGDFPFKVCGSLEEEDSESLK